MKKLLILAILIFGVAFQAQAQTAVRPLFGRVQMDVSFNNYNVLVAFLNYIENNKQHIYLPETLEGFEPYIKVIGSRDTEFENHQEYKMFDIDIQGAVVEHTLDDLEITQDMLDAKQAYINNLQAKVNALQAEKDSEQEELNP